MQGYAVLLHIIASVVLEDSRGICFKLTAQHTSDSQLTETTTITQGCYWSLVLMCACSTVQKSLATPLFNVLLPRSQPFMSVLKWSPATVLQAFFQSYPLDNFETTTTEKPTNHSMVCSVFSKKLRKLG